jgi:hypothetical protein
MQLYLKGPGDLVPLVYSVVLFSFIRLVLSHSLFPMLAQRWGIGKAGKVARFGEQGYAVVYLLVVGGLGSGESFILRFVLAGGVRSRLSILHAHHSLPSSFHPSLVLPFPLLPLPPLVS